MTQYIFADDHIIVKSEIVSVQFHFKKDSGMKYIGTSKVAFILKDGSARVIENNVISQNDHNVLKNDIINQMKVEHIPEANNISQSVKVETLNPNKVTRTITTIRKIPVSYWQ